MQIQFNTDNNIKGSEGLRTPMEQLINDTLGRFEEYVSRIEVHFTDENNSKKAKNEKRCMIEARLNGRQPVAVTHFGDDLHLALRGALDKIKSLLDSTIERTRNH